MADSRPPFSCDEAERFVRERYGIAGRATELVAEFDRNFLIEADRDRRFVLKVSPADAAEEVVRCQIVLPHGCLEAAYRAVRSAGGVCIADEVQVGFGRVGSRMWGFETQGVVPDIVTLGKPIGNGHPLAAVITTPDIARSFDTGMEYFNTFGGNPVSCAIGRAVLDVIEREQLQRHAAEVSAKLIAGLRRLQEAHELIGDVRGLGPFVGVELIHDLRALTPAGREAGRIVEAMRQRGFLLSTDGPDHNVLKIKPPLVIRHDDVDEMLAELDEVMASIG